MRSAILKKRKFEHNKISKFFFKIMHVVENGKTFLNHSWSGPSGLYSLRYGEKKDSVSIVPCAPHWWNGEQRTPYCAVPYIRALPLIQDSSRLKKFVLASWYYSMLCSQSPSPNITSPGKTYRWDYIFRIQPEPLKFCWKKQKCLRKRS